jgi:membrane associated rhomboid family serine protease
MTSGGPTVEAAPTCYRHPGRETYVHCTRCERPICPDCMRSAPVGFQCPECVAGAGAGPVRRPRTVYGGVVRRRSGSVTNALIALNVAVFVAEIFSAKGQAGQMLGGNPINPLERRFGLWADNFFGGGHEYYRLLTAAFLHVDVIHIALNMYILWLLGPPLEHLLGRLRFIALYLTCALGGGALAYFTGQGGVGASGAIFGLFSAFYLFSRRLGRDTRPILFLIVINLVFSFTVPGIGYWDHLGGLAAGAIVGAGYAYAPRGRWFAWTQTAGVAVALLAVAVLTAWRSAHLS